MKKIFSVISFSVVVVIVFISLSIYVYPRILEKQYIETKDSALLYKICKISLKTNQKELILKYCKDLFEDDYDFSDVEEKDEMLSKYLKTVLDTNDFDLYKSSIVYVSSRYSSTEIAVIECTRAVYEYYNMTGESDKTLMLFDALIENTSNIEIKDLFYTKKSSFLMSELEDFEAVEQMQEERKKIKEELAQDQS